MRTHSILRRLLAVFMLLALVMAVYVLWARPYQLRWGATEEEAKRPMPGDKLAPDPTFLATRAITIAGTPEAIWPWLIQMGYGRAGYYGFDILENLGSPLGIRSADRVLPEFQHFAVGDEVPISPFARMVFRAVEPNRYLIWAGMTADYPSSFTWALYPLDRGHTRLVSRIRWHYHWNSPSFLALELFTEFADHVAIRKILSGVKDRVEGRTETMIRQCAEFAILVASALGFLSTLAMLLLRPLTVRRWLTGLVAGAIWLIVWYSPFL